MATVLALGLVPAAALGVGQAHDAPRAVTARGAPDRTELEEALRAARARGRVPAVAGGVASGHRSPSVASVGVRRRGGPARVDRQDRFHLASLTKTVTATGVARLVERGLIDWASTPGQVLPHLAESMDPTLRDVTLRQLLTHRAGVAKFTTLPDFDALPDWQGTPERRRRAFTRWLLRRPPATPVGKYSYSNAGYTIAARMATEVSGHPWRRLVRSQVFRPLGVRTWFGWPADRPGQPWGHWLVRGRLRPAAPDAYRFPDLVAPAGDIAVRPRGFVRFLQVHLRGLRGRDTRLLRASTIRFMHRPVGSYAMGWVRRRTNGVMTTCTTAPRARSRRWRPSSRADGSPPRHSRTPAAGGAAPPWASAWGRCSPTRSVLVVREGDHEHPQDQDRGDDQQGVPEQREQHGETVTCGSPGVPFVPLAPPERSCS